MHAKLFQEKEEKCKKHMAGEEHTPEKYDHCSDSPKTGSKYKAPNESKSLKQRNGGDENLSWQI